MRVLAWQFPPDRAKWSASYPVVVLLVIGIFYVLTMPTLFVTGDSAAELSEAMSPSRTWNPSHLFTTPFYSILIEISHFFFDQGGEFIFLQLVNILLGLVCVLLLFKSLALLRCDSNLSASLALLFGLSNGMWIHATTTETGIHPQFFLLIAFYYMVKFLTKKSATHYVIASFFALSMSVLFALYMVVFVAPWLIVLVLGSRSKGNLRHFSRLLLAALVTTGITLSVPYLLAAFSEHKYTVTAIINWMTSHSEAARLAHLNPLSAEGIIRPVAGVMSLFTAPQSSLTIVKLALRGEAVQGIDIFSYCRLLLSLSVLSCIGGYVLLGLQVTHKAIPTQFFMICLLFLFGFNIMWLGSDPQFWLPGLPMILALVGLGISGVSSRPIMPGLLRGSLLLLSVLFLFLNVPREIPSIMYPGGGNSLGIASQFARNMTNPCMIISPGWS